MPAQRRRAYDAPADSLTVLNGWRVGSRAPARGPERVPAHDPPRGLVSEPTVRRIVGRRISTAGGG